jgi:hypothetical protein
MESFMPKSNVISETQIDLDGQQVKVKKLKAKAKKRGRNDRSNSLTCPNCLSKLITNSIGVLECTGDRLKLWETEFVKFHKLNGEQKVEFLKTVSANGSFQELYDRWVYAQEQGVPEEFGCGYTNTLFPPMGTVKVRIPDPIVVKRIELKLGRKLTEEELIGESPLFAYQGRVLTEWRKRAKEIRIPYIILPDEEEIYV